MLILLILFPTKNETTLHLIQQLFFMVTILFDYETIISFIRRKTCFHYLICFYTPSSFIFKCSSSQLSSFTISSYTTCRDANVLVVVRHQDRLVCLYYYSQYLFLYSYLKQWYLQLQEDDLEIDIDDQSLQESNNY